MNNQNDEWPFADDPDALFRQNDAVLASLPLGHPASKAGLVADIRPAPRIPREQLNPLPSVRVVVTIAVLAALYIAGIILVMVTA
jgi:hypothetical protein